VSGRVFSRSTVLASWIVLLAFGALSQIAMKYAGIDNGEFDFTLRAFAAAASSPWLWTAIACYVGEFVAWMVILRHSSLSSAFPTGAIVLVVVLAASRILLDDHPAGTPAAPESDAEH
jgi:hypothetical protein